MIHNHDCNNGITWGDLECYITDMGYGEKVKPGKERWKRRDIQYIEKLIYMETAITYKFYDDKGRRMTIFGKKIDETHIEVTLIKCSRKDSFNKKEAREAINSIVTSGKGKINGEPVHPSTVVIGPASVNWKKEFYKWCKENYFKREDYNARVWCNLVRFKRGNISFLTSITAKPTKLDLQ